MRQTLFPSAPVKDVAAIWATLMMLSLSILGCGGSINSLSESKQAIGTAKATVGNFIYAFKSGSSVLVDVNVRVYPASDPTDVRDFVLTSYQTKEIDLKTGAQYRFEISWPSGSIQKNLQVPGDSLLMIVGGLNSFPDIITRPDQAGIEVIHLAAFRPKISDRALYLCTQPNAAQVGFSYANSRIAEAPGAATQDVWLYAGRYMSDKANCEDRLLTIKALKLPTIAATNKGQIYIVGTGSLNLPLKMVLNYDIYDADTLFLPVILKP